LSQGGTLKELQMKVIARQNEEAVKDYFPAYEVDAVVFYGDPTRIYRARRRSDSKTFMLKTLRDERTAREAAALLKHEYDVTRRLNVPGVIQVFSLERHNNLPVIELEDFGGDSLDNIARQRRISIEEVLQIAVQVSQGLNDIHKANIMHKDINPSNIVFNPFTGVAKIIDFGISTTFTREQAALTSPQTFEGSLPYISPEQTGRMNRSIDYRTDFYSFGVTLYELLTRQPVFIVSEPIEWLHCHIAKQPVPPDQIDPSIPRQLSVIVMKLLSKTAEDRYQSARGITFDLKRCLKEFQTTGTIPPFPLAQQDISDRFQIPQRLYGRENEVAQLMVSFDQVRRGKCKMILVSGYSGIGKTCLIKEIYKPVTERKGHFVTGKFDQLKRNIPYSALSAALRDLVRQLLTEPEERLAVFRNRIQHALGQNGQLMIDIIHELALIIGPQPKTPDVPSLEAEQRFHRVFQHFIQVFCGPDHPLVIFLDDLQWADNASMKLIDLLIGNDAVATHLLLIGAYRDNELTSSHPVTLWLKELGSGNVFYEDIRLRPLSLEHLTNLLSDTLSVDRRTAAPLAEIVERKTAGNPFFTEEFLKNLYHEGLIVFSGEEQRWTWDIDCIQNRQMTENVVDLMTCNLKKMPEDSLGLIELGACIGFRFALMELSLVSEKFLAVVAECLRPAIQEGLIAPLGDAYQLLELEQDPSIKDVTVEFAFAHDRIHQAAYALLDDTRKRQAHLNIGRLLQNHLHPGQQKEKLFDISYHLNMGSTLIGDAEERAMLCRLNLDVGKQAKRSNAYQPAFSYFKKAIALLSDDAWDTRYHFTLELYTEAAEAAYLTVDYESMDQLLETSFVRAENLLDKVKLYLVKISACMARGQLLEAINIAKSALSQLGIRYPANPTKRHVVMELLKLKWRLRNTTLEDWRKRPEMTDAKHLAIMKIGGHIGGAAMFAQPNLLPLLILKAVKISFKYGHAPQSLVAYAGLGMILADALGDVERGDGYGKLALEIMERLQVKTIEGRIRHVYNAMVRHWREPIRNTLEPLHQAYLLCLEHGDFEYAAHAVAVRTLIAFEAGRDLKHLFTDFTEIHAMMKPLKQGPRIHYTENSIQKIDNLIGNVAEPSILKGRYYDIDKMFEIHKETGDKSLMFIDCISQVFLSYMFGKYEEALGYSDIAQAGADEGLQGMYFQVPYLLMDSLVRLANMAGADVLTRRRLMHQVSKNISRFKRWVKTNPTNTLNKLRLIQADRLRVLGKDLEANALFEESGRFAMAQGFVHEEALAYELCGKMHVRSGRLTLGLPYLGKARDLYRLWGAQAKVDDLHTHFPQLVIEEERKTGTATFGAPLSAVDIGSLMKALKTIAEETVHSSMVEKIIAIAIEFAGAQKGMLMLRNAEGVLHIEAEADVDGGDLRILQSIPVDKGDVPQGVINYVARTGSSIVIHDAQKAGEQIPGLETDPYIREKTVRSLLCLPILTGDKQKRELIGMLYLENNRASGSFTQERFDTLEIICLSAAGRLELSWKAAIDGLTGLFNHDYFQNILKREFELARRHGHHLSLILMDIDHFKRFNDTWGHQVGDLVLKEVSQIIKASCRGGDVVARYGGEEMVAILPMTSVEDAEIVAERIRKQIEAHRVTHKNEQLNVTISLGLACMNSTTTDKDNLIRRSDSALYRSKAGGRNRLTVA